MKVDDNKPGPIDVRRPAAREAAASRPVEPQASGAGNAGPAASVSVGTRSEVAAVAVSGAANEPELSDVELLDKLRERIDKGEFAVDYNKLARSVLDEAVASIRGRSAGQ